MNNTANNRSEYEAIAHTLQQYVNGGVSGRSEERCAYWSGHRFTDQFTLLKTEGEWKIISKVFYLHR